MELKRAPGAKHHATNDAFQRVDDAWLSSALDDTPGDDTLTGTEEDDVFSVVQGGKDIVLGLNGDDSANYGDTFGRGDRFEGGDGFDVLGLSGTYDLTITGRMLSGVEAVDVGGGGTYDLTFTRSIGQGIQRLKIDAGTGVPSRITVDGSALVTPVAFLAGTGDDLVKGGAGDDFFRVRNGGTDVFDGGGGYNRLSFYGIPNGVTFDLGTERQQVVGTGNLTITNITDVSGTISADILVGSAADNWVVANGGNDRINGLGGDDLLSVGVGLDKSVPTAVSVTGGIGFDTVDIGSNGGALAGATVTLASAEFQDTGQGTVKLVGIEAVTGTGFADALTGNKLDNALFGGDGADTLTGGVGDDRLYGDSFFGLANPLFYDGPKVIVDHSATPFDDVIDGGNGRDLLVGGAGDDTLIGGLKMDTLVGGRGDDLFVYHLRLDSAVGAGDVIQDFARGDRIDLHAIDASPSKLGNQDFHLGATASHSGDIVVQYDGINDQTVVAMFIDRDATPDMTINLTGNITLTAADFIL